VFAKAMDNNFHSSCGSRTKASTSTVTFWLLFGGKTIRFVCRLVIATLWGPRSWRRKRSGYFSMLEANRDVDNLDNSSQKQKTKTII